jgi:hypothetical protein
MQGLEIFEQGDELKWGRLGWRCERRLDALDGQATEIRQFR